MSKECGAGGRTRTDMSVTSPDFESGAYTNFATPAARGKDDNSSRRKIATTDVEGPSLVSGRYKTEPPLGTVYFVMDRDFLAEAGSLWDSP